MDDTFRMRSDIFLMGDNRTVSDDSRDWGPAPAREIVGQAFLTYWPLSRLHGL